MKTSAKASKLRRDAGAHVTSKFLASKEGRPLPGCTRRNSLVWSLRSKTLLGYPKKILINAECSDAPEFLKPRFCTRFRGWQMSLYCAVLNRMKKRPRNNDSET